MTALARVKPGQPFRPDAEAHNAFCDAAEYVRKIRGQTAAEPGRDGWQASIVQVKNNTGGALERFDVLGIAGVFPEPVYNAAEFQNGPVLHGITPAAGDHEGRFCIVLTPAADGDIVPAAVAGVCVAKIDVIDEDHGYAEIADGYHGCLASGAAGSATILWKEAGTGVLWGLVRIGNETGRVVFGKLDGDLDAGSSATLSIWSGIPLVDTGEDVTVYDWFLEAGGTLASGTKCKAKSYSGRFYVTTAECPVS